MKKSQKYLLLGFAVFSFGILFSSSVHGQTLFEHQDDHGDRHDGVATDTDLYAQTFTPTTSHILTRADVWLAQNQGNTGSSTIKLALRSASQGVPTGSDLCSDTRDASNIPVTTSFLPGDGISFSFFPSSCPTLSAGNEYALIFSRTSGSYILHIWGGSNQYPSGNRVYSLDSGATWNTSNLDYYFQEYSGEASSGPTAIKVAVILAEPNDASFSPSHTKSYYESQIIPDLKDYWCEVSFGARDQLGNCSGGQVNILINSEDIFDNNGEYYNLSSPTSEYLDNEQNFVVDTIGTTSLSFEDYDIVTVVHAGTSGQRTSSSTNMETKTWSPINHPLGSPPFKILLAEDDPMGQWAHEIGHVLGEIVPPIDKTLLPDLYNMGLTGSFGGFPLSDEGRWDVMAEGAWNASGTNPSSLSSYSKEFIGWLNEQIYRKSDYGDYWINSLETSNLGDSIFRYNLSESTSTTEENYYILEARNRNLKNWDSSLPEEKSLVLYKINTHGFPEYGYDNEGNIINQNRTINIQEVLSPNGEAEMDLSRGIRFTALSDRSINNRYEVGVRIENLIPSFFSNALKGVVLWPDQVLQAGMGEVSAPFLWGSGSPPKPDYSLYGYLLRLSDARIFGQYYIGEGVFNLIVLLPALLLVLVPFLIWRYFEPFHFLPRFEFNKKGMALLLALGITGLWFELPLRWISIDLRSEFSSPPDLYYSLYDACTGLKPWITTTAPYCMPFRLSSFIFNLMFWYGIMLALQSFRRGSTVPKRIFSACFMGAFVFAIVFGNQLEKASHKARMELNISRGPSLIQNFLPDLDLHAITPAGLHVGVNYETGEYENQIAGSMVSGDLVGGEEWIFVPSSTEAKFYVSSRDNQDFLSQNPDIASQLTTTTDSYELFARYIDPNSGIFTSETLPNETISPGSTTTYDIQGTSTPDVIREITLTPTADSYLKKGSPNQNFGSENILNVRGDGKRRTLVQFDQSAIAGAVGSSTLISATIELDIIAGSAQNLTSEGRIVGAHRLTHLWTESGVTWNCSNDINTANSSPNCSGDTWQMEENVSPSWIATSTDQRLVTNGLTTSHYLDERHRSKN